MKIPTIFFFLCFTVLSSAAAEPIREWTNVDGKTIRAQYVTSDETSVTILIGVQKFVYPLSKLTPESQALAKQLAAEAVAPSVPVAPGVDPVAKPKPAGGGGDATKVGGKALLPVIGDGKWARYHAVTEGKTFDLAVHGSGRVYLFLKDSAGELIGKPLYVSLRMGYYTKPEPQFGWPHAYYRDHADRHYKLR